MFGVPTEIRTLTEGSTNPSANHYTIGTIFLFQNPSLVTNLIMRFFFLNSRLSIHKASQGIKSG